MTGATLARMVRWGVMLFIIIMVVGIIMGRGLTSIGEDSADGLGRFANCLANGGCTFGKDDEANTSPTPITTQTPRTPPPLVGIQTPVAADPNRQIMLASNPTRIDPGGRTMLAWDVGANATEVWLLWHAGVDQGEAPVEKIRVNPKGQYPKRLDVSTFFWIEAKYADGTTASHGWVVCVGNDKKCPSVPQQ